MRKWTKEWGKEQKRKLEIVFIMNWLARRFVSIIIYIFGLLFEDIYNDDRSEVEYERASLQIQSLRGHELATPTRTLCTMRALTIELNRDVCKERYIGRIAKESGWLEWLYQFLHILINFFNYIHLYHHW